ncbi:MAG: peptidylprolyl isomerase [Pseudomonadota bacterium]
MTDLVKIDEEVINSEDFVKLLKFTGRFDELMEDIVKDKLTIHAARKQGVTVSADEIQERADQLRRVRGLHRAADMNSYLDSSGLTLEDFENFIIEMLLHEQISKSICSDEAVEEYFSLNSPKFDSIEVSHIVLDSEGKAREIMAILEDDMGSFEEFAREHSISDTREDGGYIGKVLRGSLQSEVEAKVFNASEGDLLGPFASDDETCYEIFTINAKTSSTLDEETADEVRRLIREEWLAARAREHVIDTP